MVGNDGRCQRLETMIGNPSPMMLCAIAIEFVAKYDVHRVIAVFEVIGPRK